MNKNNIPPGIGFTIILVFFSFLSFANEIDSKLDKEIKNRVESLPTVISIQYNAKVRSKINHLINTNRKVSEVMLGRSSIYFPLIEAILREKNLPEDLKYLAVIESGLNPHAVSSARATGLWQFMKPTAKYIGLKITRAVDERKDPIKSTYAALEYLEKLNKQFGDWTLALAAYNCGPGNVRKAIRRSGGHMDYWKIQKYLPRETQNYVPKAIAMHYVMKYYYAHDLWPEQVDDNLKFTASVRVFDKIELKDIANQYDLNFEIIKDLNPSFLRNFIPESEGKHYLTLPETHLIDYVNKTNLHDHLFQVSMLASKQHKAIANQKLAENTNVELKRLETKQIPKLGHRAEKGIIMNNPVRYKLVKLKKGQSIADLSIEYGIDLNTLIKENNFSENNLPKQGDVIKIIE
jgi:membrane-bound lytic murein transglycosylase D